ncbi:Ubiquitin-like-specific protease 1, partial [Colletotrichum scovillei]
MPLPETSESYERCETMEETLASALTSQTTRLGSGKSSAQPGLEAQTPDGVSSHSGHEVHSPITIVSGSDETDQRSRDSTPETAGANLEARHMPRVNTPDAATSARSSLASTPEAYEANYSTCFSSPAASHISVALTPGGPEPENDCGSQAITPAAFGTAFDSEIFSGAHSPETSPDSRISTPTTTLTSPEAAPIILAHASDTRASQTQSLPQGGALEAEAQVGQGGPTDSSWQASRLLTPPLGDSEAMLSPSAKTAGTTIGDQSISDFIVESVEVIRRLSQDPKEGSQETIQMIAQQLKESESHVPSSNGSAWFEILERRESERRRATLFNLIELMGFAHWHQSQISALCRMNTGISGKIGSSRVIDEILSLKYSKNTEPGIVSKSRNFLNTQLTRGRKLLQLVKELGYGVLFVKEIWELLKSTKRVLEHSIEVIKRDADKRTILEHLDRQFELLLQNGVTDLAEFIDGLQTEQVELTQKIHWQHVDPDELNDEVNCLIDITKGDGTSQFLVLSTSSQNNVNDSLLSATDFEKLRPEETLTHAMISTALHMADKASCVRIGEIINAQDPASLSKAKAQTEAWHDQLDPYQNQELLCFFPLQHSQDHFSLLEIDERGKRIRHYNPNQDKVLSRKLQQGIRQWDYRMSK